MGTVLIMYQSGFLALLPLLLSQAHGLDVCPDGWMEAHGVDMGCLYFSHPKDHKSHDDAKAYCVEKHEEAYLVEVRSPVEETFLHLALQIMEEGSGESLSSDGMAGTWQPGEPQEGEGNCAVMESRKGFTWKATPCGMIASFICQIDGPTNPTESPLL